MIEGLMAEGKTSFLAQHLLSALVELFRFIAVKRTLKEEYALPFLSLLVREGVFLFH